jgi:diacylglycerol kinase (ATP)
MESHRPVNERLADRRKEAETMRLAFRKGRLSSSLIASFRFAFAGFWYVVRTQRNMRIHLLFAAAVVSIGLYVRLEWTQWAILGLTMGFVLVAEMFNTVAEAAMDAATPYYHPLVQVAKDVAAGAVLVTALISVSVGLLVMGPPLWAKIVECWGR